MRSARNVVMVLAGGTGGHIYPALAVAEQLALAGVELSWLGSRGGMENRLVPPTGIPLHCLSISGVRRAGLMRLITAPAQVGVAIVQALRTLMQVRPGVVLGMGGFASGPGGIAAWLLRIPLVVHEQNAIPGLTNRILARFATTVFEAFPGAFPPAVKALAVGNPVRDAIVTLPFPRPQSAAPVRVLVAGGSRGARALNEALPEVLAGIDGVEIWHQCGAGFEAATRARYDATGRSARVAEFIDDMSAAYGWAHLVVCRAGALTVSELAAAGAPAVLVPYPYAVDDHQSVNARFLTEHGAARLVAEGEGFAARLRAALTPLLHDADARAAMAREARALARPDAAGTVAARCRELLHV